MKKLLSVKEVAAVLGISRSRVQALISAGRINASKIGGGWVVKDYSRAVVRKNGRPGK